MSIDPDAARIFSAVLVGILLGGCAGYWWGWAETRMVRIEHGVMTYAKLHAHVHHKLNLPPPPKERA